MMSRETILAYLNLRQLFVIHADNMGQSYVKMMKQLHFIVGIEILVRAMIQLQNKNYYPL